MCYQIIDQFYLVYITTDLGGQDIFSIAQKNLNLSSVKDTKGFYVKELWKRDIMLVQKLLIRDGTTAKYCNKMINENGL